MTTLMLIVLAVAAIGVVVYGVGIYNELIGIRTNVDKSWANIEVLEKQRFDEIPKLVKVCEGYMQYEQNTLEKVIQARNTFLSATGPAGVAEANGQLAGALKSLFALSENYPNLKADANFRQLQERVTELENQIADRREFYNDSVTIHNTRIEQVPYVFLAKPPRYVPRELYKVAPAEKVNPEINFQQPK